MAFQQVPDTAQVTVHYQLGGQELINTYHAYYSAGYNQSLLDTLASSVAVSPVVSLLADQSGYLWYDRVEVRGLDQENDLTSVYNANSQGGGLGAQAIPATNAFAVQRLSGLTGRNARGRVYVAGIPTNYLELSGPDVGQITLAAANAYQGHIDGFRSTIDALPGADPVIVSRYHNGSKRTTAVTFTWTTTAYHDRVLDVLRSRKRSSD